IYFSGEDITRPSKDLPIELHQKYGRFSAEISHWKKGLDALKDKHKVRGNIWDPLEIVPY
ncbi:hypothetical protein ACFLU6_15980, partial [Acidobacteriota bacterium]